MEFGWREADAVPHDNFADFLRWLLRAYPGGPCSAAMAPYFDHCRFVGKIETLSRDLGAALTQAGETFDPSMLDAPSVNISSNAAIRQACVAPHDLLSAVLDADASFCRQFSYSGVPPELVGEHSGSPWPKLQLKPSARTDVALALSRPIFTYRLDDEAHVRGDPVEQRLQWALIKAIEDLETPGRVAVVSEVDPYPAVLLAAKPGAQVTFVPADRLVTPARLMSHLRDQPAVVDFQSFHAADKEEDFDTIMLVDSAEISGAIEGELLLTAQRLNIGGRLLLVAPVLLIDEAFGTTFKVDWNMRGGSRVAYRSLPEWRVLLANCGFEDMEIVDQFDEAPPPTRQPHVETLADALGVDPAHLLGKALLSARRSGERSDNMRDLCVRRRLLSIRAAYASLPAAVEARFLMLEREVETERLRRTQAEQGVADREADLLVARRELHALLVDLDFAAERLRRADHERLLVQTQLDQLRTLVSQLGVSPPALTQGQELPVNDSFAGSALASLRPALRLLPERKVSAQAS
jgi:hypothetical protein